MKPWARRLTEHVEEWSQRHPRRSIPKHVYHFTDVRNAASILERGALYSRRRAREEGCMAIDQASAVVIAQTRPAYQEFARLYFRPRTPTQYRNEGIRPPDVPSEYTAHCPVPVFFCFDFVETLRMDGTQFSDGNMGSPKAHFDDSEDFFEQLPFESIYHDGPIVDKDKPSVIFHRHAEVLVPNSLALNHKLRAIVCRSAAERLTLLHMLKPKTRRVWSERVRVAPALFYRQWWYVRNVKAGEGR